MVTSNGVSSERANRVPSSMRRAAAAVTCAAPGSGGPFSVFIACEVTSRRPPSITRLPLGRRPGCSPIRRRTALSSSSPPWFGFSSEQSMPYRAVEARPAAPRRLRSSQRLSVLEGALRGQGARTIFTAAAPAATGCACASARSASSICSSRQGCRPMLPRARAVPAGFQAPFAGARTARPKEFTSSAPPGDVRELYSRRRACAGHRDVLQHQGGRRVRNTTLR